MSGIGMLGAPIRVSGCDLRLLRAASQMSRLYCQGCRVVQWQRGGWLLSCELGRRFRFTVPNGAFVAHLARLASPPEGGNGWQGWASGMSNGGPQKDAPA